MPVRKPARQVRSLSFESFGVRFRIHSESSQLIERTRERLALVFGSLIRFRELRNCEQVFHIELSGDREIEVFDVQTGIRHPLEYESFDRTFESMVRNRVAEMARGHVFIHAGAVTIEGRAIILPGRSFAGKTTLVKALVERGAVYYSDDFAVLDPEGRVLPFPKPLSVRRPDGEREYVDVEAKALGAAAGRDPASCGLVFLSQYDEKARWAPLTLSPAEGLLRLIEHTVPVRTNTEFSLKVLNKLALRAIIAESRRADADAAAIKIINYFNRLVIGLPRD
ncbi:MAG: hypothetical protein J5I65_00440 [Aridibacter famidurans]|nr:hypothetical protein [Aridibacter famidurans]